MPQITSDIFVNLSPVIILFCTALVILLAQAFSNSDRKDYLAYFGLIGLTIAFFTVYYLWSEPVKASGGMAIADKYSLFFWAIFIVGAAITTLISIEYAHIHKMGHGEFFALLLFATLGMQLMVMSQDLILFFISLEIMSISIYVLVGFARRNRAGAEAALKYYLLGAFSSAIMLYGIALIYGGMGTTNLVEISQHISAEIAQFSGDSFHFLTSNPLRFAGMILLLSGFCFKIASVPFHMWTPDVYQGAPTPITAFMAVGVKAAAFAALIRIFGQTFFNGISQNGSTSFFFILCVLSVLTMTIGNLMAIIQTNLKRMLAFSSIAHAGYLLIGVITIFLMGNKTADAVGFYLMAYTIMSLGAFGIIIFFERQEGQVDRDNLNGVGFKYPLISVAMAVFMFAMAGIPPFNGFFAKFFLFSQAIDAGHINPWMYLLVIIAVINSLFSVIYYLRVIVAMFMKEESTENLNPLKSPPLYCGILIAVILVIQMGIFPDKYLALAKESIQVLLNL